MLFGGAERVMSILANSFAKNGHEVGLILMNDDRTLAYELDENIVVDYMPGARFNSFKQIFRMFKSLRDLIKGRAPDIIISFFSSTATFAYISSLGQKIPLIYSERNDPHNNIKGWKNKMFQHVALRCARRIVFQTPGARNYYGQNIQKKSTIILNPLDCEKLPERKAECIDDRIVTVGRLYPQKNHKMLINAFSMSKAKETHSLHIYGEGSLRNELEKKIIEMNLTDKVFLEGTSKSVHEDIKNAKLFAFTSDYEGLPNALIEAMAIGIPCVSTDCSPGGAKMIINDGENGRLIECGNAEAFARALDDTLFNREKQEKFSANGINIRHRVATGKITDEWLNFINTVVKNRKSLLQNT